MKGFTIAGALNMLLSVGLGAFGAHILKERIASDLMTIYQTGVQYHMAHALGLLLIAVLSTSTQLRSKYVKWAGWLIIAGIVLFSGSLYVLAMSGVRSLGAITPLGGFAFVIGWLLLIIAALRPKS